MLAINAKNIALECDTNQCDRVVLFVGNEEIVINKHNMRKVILKNLIKKVISPIQIHCKNKGVISLHKLKLNAYADGWE